MPPVLLVDPDRNFRQALAIALRLDGFAVETSSSVEEAFDVLARGAIRCCVVDCFVPGIDALFARLRQDGVTAFAVCNHPECLREVMKRHPWLSGIDKPFHPAELVGRLAQTEVRASAL